MLDNWDEVLIVPVEGEVLVDVVALDMSVPSVGEHSGRMVAPDDHLLHSLHGLTHLLGQLVLGSIMV